ncbi:MAG: GTP-binding protein [Hyphomicrobiales bacterium]|nr:GTP-binding protein [Hyphomicrobiales bacterium]
MAQRIQIPILILTGFLGSGKTSLLSRWLRAPEFEGAMVVVNELGEVGLDDRLVQHSSEVPLLLENGCACCEAAEDLNATLERLFWQRLHRQIPRFNWVLIETTGVADPGPLLASLHGHELISERYRVHGVITTFDARRGPTQLLAHGECRNQVQSADAVILTKTDIASASEQATAIEAIKAQRPDANILASARSSVSASQIVAALDGLHGGRRDAPVTHGHAHDHHDDHHHSHNHDHSAHHAGDYTTAFVPLPLPLQWSSLKPALSDLLAAHGENLLRLKGIARTGADGALEVVQAIAGEEFERTPLNKRTDGKPVLAGLTIIARTTPANAIARDLLVRLGIAATAQPVHNSRGAAAHA